MTQSEAGGRFLLVVVASLASGMAAGEWQQGFSLPMTSEYNSNATFATTRPVGLWRLMASPTYRLTSLLGAGELNGTAALMLEEPSNKTILPSRQDPNLSLDWQRQFETSAMGLTAGYNRASTLFSELEESGLVVAQGSRTTRSLGANVRRDFSARDSLAADVGYKDVSYSGGGLINFKQTTAGLTLSHRSSDALEPFLRLSLSHYDPEDNRTVRSSENVIAMVGGKFRTSEQLDWVGQFGRSRISNGATTTGSVGGLVAHYNGGRYDGSVDVGRAISTSGQGGYMRADHLSGAIGYLVSERTRVGLNASRQKNGGLTPNTMDQIRLSATRDLSLNWSAQMYYQYKQRQQEGLNRATANVLGVTLSYGLPNF